MKKILYILLLMMPFAVFAGRKSESISQVVEIQSIKNNAYGVNQEKLDMYRMAHPRYNFPKHLKDLNKNQAKQILDYFWDNYRFSDYKYDEIQEKVWDMMIHMSISELEKQINQCIRRYYNFDESFYVAFGSIASVSLLNGMAPKNIPDFYLILNEIKY